MSEKWAGIQPGDLGFTTGFGRTGWLGSGHSFVYHSQEPDGSWHTIEAAPSWHRQLDGVRWRHRTEAPEKVVRIARTPDEVAALLAESRRWVGKRYDWLEIAGIVAYLLGIGWLARRLKRGERDAAICSHHTAAAALAARPELAGLLPAPCQVWPGELAMAVDALVWNDVTLAESPALSS